MSDTSKDVGDVREEAKIVTKQMLETAIRSKEGCDELTVKNFTVEAGSAFGDNFVTVVFRVKVTIITENGEEKKYALFLKTSHDNEYAKKWTFEKSKLFLKEGRTYSEIIPDMIRYQKDIGIEPFGPSVPPFYYSVFENYTGIILLEDIRPHGYRMADKLSGLDYEHCKLVMKELAAFHALSFALKNGSPENLKKYDFIFKDSVVTTSVPVFLKEAVKPSVNMMKTRTTSDDIRQRVDQLLSLDLEETLRDLLKPKEPYALICHGDMWCNNLLFKYDSTVDNQNPRDLKLVDLQIVRYALPSLDLVYFFHTSTTRTTRKKYMTDLLHVYHSTFMDCLKKLRLDFPEFSFEVLEQMMKDSMMFGVLTACMVHPAILSADPPKIEGKTDAELQESLEKHFKKVATMDDNIGIIIDRLLGSVEDAIEAGVM